MYVEIAEKKQTNIYVISVEKQKTKDRVEIEKKG